MAAGFEWLDTGSCRLIPTRFGFKEVVIEVRTATAEGKDTGGK